jgi:hyperosmotically inducible protein
MRNQKGGSHAVDHMCHSLGIVVAGIVQRLHTGWSHSRSPGHRPHCGGGPGYSGPKAGVTIKTLAGSPQEGAGEYVDDSVITTKVKSQLAADDFLKSFQISVETYKGIVQLSGFVGSQMAVNKAGEIARGVQGVKSVKNDLIVK